MPIIDAGIAVRENQAYTQGNSMDIFIKNS